jgi:hypothetical protein
MILQVDRSLLGLVVYSAADLVFFFPFLFSACSWTRMAPKKWECIITFYVLEPISRSKSLTHCCYIHETELTLSGDSGLAMCSSNALAVI